MSVRLQVRDVLNLSQNDSVGRPGTAQQILLQDEARAKRRPIDARNQRTATHSRKKAQPVRPIQLHRWLCIPQAASRVGRCLRKRHVCGAGRLGNRSLPRRRFEEGTRVLLQAGQGPGSSGGRAMSPTAPRLQRRTARRSVPTSEALWGTLGGVRPAIRNDSIEIVPDQRGLTGTRLRPRSQPCVAGTVWRGNPWK
jgi:hypothetical protein